MILSPYPHTPNVTNPSCFGGLKLGTLNGGQVYDAEEIYQNM